MPALQWNERTITRLFDRMTTRYADAWVRKWEAVNPASMAEDWIEVMDGISAEGVKFGLQNLPDRPPNASEFRSLCMSMPVPVEPMPALPGPSANPEFVKGEVQKMNLMAKPAGFDFKAWAWRLKAREESGEKLSKAQRDMWRAALGVEAPAVAPD
jgi:hypothetical protein